jgi:hypothetical protein
MGLLDKLRDVSPRFGELDEAAVQAHEESEEEKRLASWIRNKVEETRSSANRTASEGIWMTNIAYLLGYSGVQYNSSTRQFQQTNDAGAYLRQKKIHVNKILPTVQNRLAKLCKNPPKYDVLPESNLSKDKDAARLALDVLQAELIRLNSDEKRLELYMWMQEVGHAYIGIYWDVSKGKLIEDPETGETDFEGDCRLDVVSAFEMFPDPLAKTLDDCQYIIRAKVRPIEYFRTQYGEKGALVKQEDTWLLSAQYESRINSINTRGPIQNGQTKNTAIELAYYERPCKQYPEGRMCIAANGVLLENKELPLGELPFVKFDDVLIGGKYYSESIITHLRPLQDAYNMGVRARTEWVRKLLTGKFMAARGSQLAQESFNDQSGEIVYYTPVPNAANGGMPIPVQMPVIPQYAYTEQESLDNQFNEISGISEVSKGNLPSASIPAIGMQLLVEQDDTRVGVVTEKNEHGWAKVGSLILKCIQKNYVMPRKIKMAGKNSWIVKEITGDEITTTDVKVMRGSTLPGSKILKRQEILNAYQQGLLGDPQDPTIREKVLESLEFGDVSEMWEDLSIDEAQIRRGIDMLEDGELPPIDEGDNHAMWIRELTRYMKQEKFQELEPMNQQLFRACREAHLEALMQISGAMPPEEDEEMKIKADAQATEQSAQSNLNQTQPTAQGL